MIMINTLRLNLTKLIILAASGLILLFFLTNTVFSQSPSPTTAAPTTPSLTFPIDGLGGCGDLEACTSYCEDPIDRKSVV